MPVPLSKSRERRTRDRAWRCAGNAAAKKPRLHPKTRAACACVSVRECWRDTGKSQICNVDRRACNPNPDSRFARCILYIQQYMQLHRHYDTNPSPDLWLILNEDACRRRFASPDTRRSMFNAIWSIVERAISFVLRISPRSATPRFVVCCCVAIVIDSCWPCSFPTLPFGDNLICLALVAERQSEPSDTPLRSCKVCYASSVKGTQRAAGETLTRRWLLLVEDCCLILLRLRFFDLSFFLFSFFFFFAASLFASLFLFSFARNPHHKGSASLSSHVFLSRCMKPSVNPISKHFSLFAHSLFHTPPSIGCLWSLWPSSASPSPYLWPPNRISATSGHSNRIRTPCSRHAESRHG